ncbi:MAG TPA: glutathione S-transferase N-terminal domain-containing protein [Gaiellaceae bacterium]|nr:glutathione S-transferase N-terminal domain-containing protein [Gaiellaceae bacterium]
MAIKLHRCGNIWVKMSGHPCWKVQSALDEQGIEYELVPMPSMRWNREETEKATGQKKYPWIEFEDGSIYREESKDMAARIRAGQLNEAPRAQPSAPA